MEPIRWLQPARWMSKNEHNYNCSNRNIKNICAAPITSWKIIWINEIQCKSIKNYGKANNYTNGQWKQAPFQWRQSFSFLDPRKIQNLKKKLHLRIEQRFLWWHPRRHLTHIHGDLAVFCFHGGNKFCFWLTYWNLTIAQGFFWLHFYCHLMIFRGDVACPEPVVEKRCSSIWPQLSHPFKFLISGNGPQCTPSFTMGLVPPHLNFGFQ